MTSPRLVGGRYELGPVLGYGGMAEVHRGRDVRLGRDVAIKVLRSDLARDPSFQNRFRREAQAAAGLNHPAIVAVYDTGEDSSLYGPEVPAPYIVMEFVEGRSLREILNEEGTLDGRRAMEITADVCSALDFSHRSGIVHRDIKPGNVMITNAGQVKVMDFGIARALADNAATMTATQAVIGTAQYLSPEQARGESVDARSDVYSTGCLLYELLTGHPPFTGDSPVAVAYQHVRENPQPPSNSNSAVPPVLDAIVMKSLAKNPLNRYQTAAEMRTDLDRALAGQRVEAETVMTDAERTQLIAASRPGGARPAPLTPVYDDEPPNHRGAVIWTAVVLALLLVIGGVAFFLLRDSGKQKAPTTYAVPSLAGLSVSAARDALRQTNLQPSSADPEGSSGPCTSGGPQAAVLKTPVKGTVCTQDPAAGTQEPANFTVTFTVYTGPPDVQVQSVVGLSYTDAQKALAAQGLIAVRVNVDSSQPADQVIDQNPPGGAMVAPSSKVQLKVANGKIKLPDVTKLSYNDAKAKLNQLGFTNVSEQTAPVQAPFKVGQVMSMNQTAGITYDPNTGIVLTVAVLPTCSTPPATPSDTTSPTGSATGSGSPSTTPSSSPSPTGSPTCTPAG